MFTKTILFGAIIVAAASFAFCQNGSGAKQKTTAKPAATIAAAANQPVATAKAETRQLVVYYFMTTYRCPSCVFIEGTTRKAIDETFAPELKSGRLVFRMVNIEEKGNEHFTDDYKLYTKSVVLSDLKDGKESSWKNLDQVWSMIKQEERFKTYIINEIKALL